MKTLTSEAKRSAAVRVATTRCPYCHQSVEHEEPGWVSCRRCLARHHQPCWGELTACGSCGEARFVTDPGAQDRRPAPSLVRRFLQRLAGAVAFMIVWVALMASLFLLHPARDILILTGLFTVLGCVGAAVVAIFEDFEE